MGWSKSIFQNSFIFQKCYKSISGLVHMKHECESHARWCDEDGIANKMKDDGRRFNDVI